MPDITMCEGTGCALKETCYRYLATPSTFMQSYFETPPLVDDKCSHYWETKSKSNDQSRTNHQAPQDI